MVDAEANEEAASAQGSNLSSIETQLINTSSELVSGLLKCGQATSLIRTLSLVPKGQHPYKVAGSHSGSTVVSQAMQTFQQS